MITNGGKSGHFIPFMGKKKKSITWHFSIVKNIYIYIPVFWQLTVSMIEAVMTLTICLGIKKCVVLSRFIEVIQTPLGLLG